MFIPLACTDLDYTIALFEHTDCGDHDIFMRTLRHSSMPKFQSNTIQKIVSKYNLTAVDIAEIRSWHEE